VVLVGVVMVPMMVPRGSERRGSNQQQQQGSEEKLLHAKTVAPSGLRRTLQARDEILVPHQVGK
jgi:hypothetical protein